METMEILDLLYKVWVMVHITFIYFKVWDINRRGEKNGQD